MDADECAHNFITRVVVENYRSIASCDVRLGPLTFLVGPNGSGKSNFLDAIRFLSGALQHTLDQTVRERGGVNEISRRGGNDAAAPFGIRLDFKLPDEVTGHYAVRIAARPPAEFEVRDEECIIRAQGDSATEVSSFVVRQGELQTSTSPALPAAPDRLYLMTASALPQFRPLYDALSRMRVYNIVPQRMRDFHHPAHGEIMNRDGSNIVSVLRMLRERDPARYEWIEAYLRAIVPEIEQFHAKSFGSLETLEFEYMYGDIRTSFLAESVSDGTLRALGVLTALFQGGDNRTMCPSLIGMEEPEAGLHPAAAGVLLDAMRVTSAATQVIVTSHSADLLDDDDIPSQSILGVVMEGGATRIGPLDAVAQDVLREHRFTAGELLRVKSLRPEPADVLAAKSPHLFDQDVE